MNRKNLVRFVVGIFLVVPFSSNSIAQQSVKPIIKQVDHILIRADDPKYLFSLLTETLQLPIAWPIKTYSYFTSGGVAVGNVNIEVIGNERHAPDTLSANAQFVGFAFQPYPLNICLPELERRGIAHGHSRPYISTRPDGSKKLLWTTVGLPEYSSNQNTIFLCEYSFNADVRRDSLRNELASKSGGSLGCEFVKEIIMGSEDYEKAVERWQNLLKPISASSSGLWQVGGGPAIRIVSNQENRIQGLVLKVASLTRAKAFLEEQRMLGTITEEGITIHPLTAQGLKIRLVEK